MAKPPIGHTLVVLATLAGCFAVLTVYAVSHQQPPGEIIALITAVSTGSAGAYLAPRQGAAGQTGGQGETGQAGAPGAAGAPGTPGQQGRDAAAPAATHE